MASVIEMLESQVADAKQEMEKALAEAAAQVGVCRCVQQRV